MKRGILLFGLLLLILQGVFAANYYVSTTGDNSNPGTEALPFKTIAKGISVLQPGDTVYARGGTYNESIENYGQIPAGDSWANPVTIAAYPGESVTLRPESCARVMLFVGTQYVIVDGFIMDAINCVSDVVKITWGSGYYAGNHIRIQNSEIMNGHQGILVNDENYSSGYNEFINLSVHDNGEDDFAHGFYITNDHNLIEGCRIYNNAGWGVHIYNSNGPDYNTVRNNLIYDNARVGNRGPGIGMYEGVGNVAYNNIIWGNNVGIMLNYNINNAEVYNNIVYSNTGSYGGIYIGSTSTNASIKNNIVWQNPGSQIQDVGTGTVIDHNFINDPFFVDANNLDFHLQANSSAIDAGTTVNYATSDFDGNSRPQGSAYDVGAYEYVVAVPQISIGNLISRSTTGTITLDGVLNENAWSQASKVNFSNPSRSDNFVSVYSIWDADNLYFAYFVNDANLEYVGLQLWRDDGSEIYIDTDNDKGGYDSDDYHFLTTINDSSSPEIPTKTATNGSGYVTEIAIPWSSFNLTTPSNNTVMGLLLGNNDRDNGIPAQFDWLGVIETGSYSDPSLWGNITLVNLTQIGNEEETTGTTGTSGGGGGGGGSVTPSVTQIQKIDQATPLQSIIFTGFNPDLRIKQVEVRVNAEVQNAGLAISKYESKPEVIPVEKPGLVYRYLEFQEINIGDKLDKAIITFFVDKDWVDGNELKPTDVAFFRYNEGVTSWNELPTKYNTSDDDYYYYYYEAESDDFGYFAIGEQNRSILEAKFGSTAFFLLLGGIIILAIVVMLVIRFVIKKRNQAYDAGTYPLAKK